MANQVENTNFYQLWGLSRQALSYLQSARELFLQSSNATTITERLRLQAEAITLQIHALQLLKESNRLLRSQVAEEKAKIARQRADHEDEELVPQDLDLISNSAD